MPEPDTKLVVDCSLPVGYVGCRCGHVEGHHDDEKCLGGSTLFFEENDDGELVEVRHLGCDCKSYVEVAHARHVALSAADLKQKKIDAGRNPELPRRRHQRNALLAASDWTQTAGDAPLTDKQRKAWADYRQHLRDNPAGPWPEPPL